MSKPIIKPIKKIVKPVTNVLGGQSKKQPSQTAGNTQLTTADIKPDDPRLNQSQDQILANRKKRLRGRINPIRETSLLNEGNLSPTGITKIG